MMKINVLLFLFINQTTIFAQLPDTDIFIADIKDEAGNLSFSQPINITNRKGYDNQPYFSSDGKSILYVAYKDSIQSDIFKYNLTTKKTSQLTNTPESEYSPNLIPDGKSISVVRVDKDSGQRFYTIPFNDLSSAHLIKGSDSIGYYCWLNDSSVAMFILGDVMSLQILNTNTSERKWIASDIGRCMKLSPDKTKMYFVLKQNPTEWSIFQFEIATNKMNKVISTLTGSEDFAVMPDESLLMGSEGKLYLNKSGSSEWKVVADFTSSLKDFYRITINPKADKIALVSFTGKKP
jgi:Tol biopolymer transport system component